MSTETQEPTISEQMGEIEEEKTFTSEKLGGAFTFRLPFVYDELAVLRRRAQIMGVADDLASEELRTVAHAQAMFEIFCVHSPRGFKVEKLRSWAPFLSMLAEVGQWHTVFFQSLGD